MITEYKITGQKETAFEKQWTGKLFMLDTKSIKIDKNNISDYPSNNIGDIIEQNIRSKATEYWFKFPKNVSDDDIHKFLKHITSYYGTVVNEKSIIK